MRDDDPPKTVVIGARGRKKKTPKRRKSKRDLRDTLSQASTQTMGNKRKDFVIQYSDNDNDNDDDCDDSSIVYDEQQHNPDVYFKTDKQRSLLTLNHYESLVEAEIEEAAIDVAIDSAILDLTGLPLDCAMIRDNSLIRKWVRGKDYAEFFQAPDDRFPDYTDYVASSTTTRNGYNSDANRRRREGDRQQSNSTALTSEVARERETWMLFSLDMRDALARNKAPLPMTSAVAARVKSLPERDVSLYIRLDEEIPKNSCTVYQIDMNRFERGKRDKLFRFFRICARNSQDLRADSIAGTLASACFRPYTMVPSSSTATAEAAAAEVDSFNFLNTAKMDRAVGSNGKGNGNGNGAGKKSCAPFRPRFVYLDEESDVKDTRLQCFFRSMGINHCQVVDPLLRELHEESDLDFFHGDEDLEFGEDNTDRPNDAARDDDNGGYDFDDDDWEIRDIITYDEEESLTGPLSLVVNKESKAFVTRCGPITLPFACLGL